MKRILILFLISITLTPLFAGPRERDIVYETGRVFFSAYDAMESARSQAEKFIQTYELLSPSWQEKTYDQYITILEKSFGKEIAASIRSEMEWNIWNGNFENISRSGALRMGIYEFQHTPLWGEIEADEFEITYELNGEIKNIDISGKMKFFTWLEDGRLNLSVETEDLESGAEDIGNVRIEVSVSEDFSDFKCKLDGKELGREDIKALMPIFSLIENL